MKRMAVRLVVPALTFLIGMAAATVWFQKPYKRFADDIYFPVGIFLPREGGMNWVVKFYSSGLAAMQEPPISTLEGDGVEVYRLLYLPAFEPPVAIRLWRDGGQAYMSVKQLSAPGGAVNGEAVFPKTMKVNATRPLKTEEWARFQGLLKNANFWTQPTEGGRQPGLDGANFLLEGYMRGQYHVMDRWTPEEDEILQLSDYLFEISGLEFP
jgi:hypothetical protein